MNDVVTIEHVFFVIKKPDIVFCLYETPSCDQLVYSNNEHINSWIIVILFNIKEVYCQHACADPPPPHPEENFSGSIRMTSV